MDSGLQQSVARAATTRAPGPGASPADETLLHSNNEGACVAYDVNKGQML